MSVITAHSIQPTKSPQPHVLFAQRVGQSADPRLGHHDFYGRPKVATANVSGSPLPTFSGARTAWLSAFKQSTTQHAVSTFAWLQRQQQASVKTFAHVYHGVQRVDPNKSAQAVLMSGAVFVLGHQLFGDGIHAVADAVGHSMGPLGGLGSAGLETLLECVTASVLGQKIVGKAINWRDTVLVCFPTSLLAHGLGVPQAVTEWVMHGGTSQVAQFGEHLQRQHHHGGLGSGLIHYLSGCLVPNTVGDWAVRRVKALKTTLQDIATQADPEGMRPMIAELEAGFSRGSYVRPERPVEATVTP